MLLVFGIFSPRFFDEEAFIVRCLQTSEVLRLPRCMRQATHSENHVTTNGHTAPAYGDYPRNAERWRGVNGATSSAA